MTRARSGQFNEKAPGEGQCSELLQAFYTLITIADGGFIVESEFEL